MQIIRIHEGQLSTNGNIQLSQRPIAISTTLNIHFISFNNDFYAEYIFVQFSTFRKTLRIISTQIYSAYETSLAVRHSHLILRNLNIGHAFALRVADGTFFYVHQHQYWNQPFPRFAFCMQSEVDRRILSRTSDPLYRSCGSFCLWCAPCPHPSSLWMDTPPASIAVRVSVVAIIIIIIAENCLLNSLRVADCEFVVDKHFKGNLCVDLVLDSLT